MRFQELIDYLEHNPTETTLSDIGIQYHIVPVDPGDLVNIGFILVPVDEGIAVLPYTAVLPEEGFEQINLGGAELLDGETAAYYLRLVKDKIASLAEASRLLEEVASRCA